jgi:hypothetical protein
MSPTTSAATSGGITAELRNWARGCHSTEAAVELLIKARGGKFADAGQPWLRTDDRGITWLDPEVIGGTRMSCPQESATFWRSSRPSQLASRSKMWAVSWAAWTPTISISSLPSCGTPAVAAGRHVLPHNDSL